MYCSRCGKPIPNGSNVCPECGPETVEAQVVYTPEKPKKKFFNSPSTNAKGYAAVATAFMVFPALICMVIDLLYDKPLLIDFDNGKYWFGFVVGALILVWFIAVYPFLRITRPAVTAVIIFVAIMSYVWYVAWKFGNPEWMTQLAMPLTVLSAAFVAADVSLIGGRRVKGLHILTLLSAESVIFSFCLEALSDLNKFGVINLRWSLVFSCISISVIAIMEAFSYVGRINRK